MLTSLEIVLIIITALLGLPYIIALRVYIKNRKEIHSVIEKEQEEPTENNLDFFK